MKGDTTALLSPQPGAKTRLTQMKAKPGTQDHRLSLYFLILNPVSSGMLQQADCGCGFAELFPSKSNSKSEVSEG